MPCLSSATSTFRGLFKPCLAVLCLVASCASADPLRPLPSLGDQRAHIQSALDALPAGRSFTAELSLEGDFPISGPLLLDSYTRLNLSSARLSLTSYDAVSLLVNRHGGEGGERQVEIIGGELVGNRSRTGSLGAGCIALYRTSKVRIEGVTVRECSRDGILISGRGQRTYHALLRDLVLENNRRNGLTVAWAMRNIQAEGIVARGNGGTGVYSDHSESDYHNIRAVGNELDGIFVRNVFHNDYHNLHATNNGRHGIRVVAMVESSGRGWRAFNNGRNDSAAADILFMADASMSYGITRDTSLDGLVAGDSRWVPSGQARYALEIERALDPRRDYSNLSFRGVMLRGAMSAPQSRGVSIEVN